MELSYENMINLTFDKPLVYKNLLLYPATLAYYSIFSTAEECLDVSRLDEKNVRLLRLSYLDYLYTKSLLDKEFKAKWEMLVFVLKIVFGDKQPFDIVRENGNIYIKVYRRSGNYELLSNECNNLKENFLQEYKEGKKKEEDIEEVAGKMAKLQEKMYNFVMLDSEDFDKIRQMIMLQNDIKPQHYDKKTEKFLNEMRKKMRAAKSSNNTTSEDLITIVSLYLHKDQKELENMTIRRFNRYLHIITTKDDYYMYKQLELGGMIKMKSQLPHWISHFEPKGKFDDLIVDSGGLMSSFDGENKI